jgi:hypothetical protein
MSADPSFVTFGWKNWREEQVLVYGHRTIWHDTVDGDKPLCWQVGFSTVSEQTPGYEDPAWGAPHLAARGDLVDQGFRQCANCRRNLGWGVGYIKSLIVQSLTESVA